MRTFAAYTLLLVMLSQAFYNVWATAYWMANRAYIARTLCEKRDTKEAACCQGKCYLEKQLVAATEEQTPQNSTPKAPALKKGLEIAEPPFSSALPSQGCLKVELAQQTLVCYTPQWTGRLATSDIFHPPPVMG